MGAITHNDEQTSMRLSGAFSTLEQTLWLIPLLAAMLIGQAVLAIVLGGFLSRAFLCSGGRRLTAYGCYCYACFLFAAYAGATLMLDPQYWYWSDRVSTVLPLTVAAIWLTSITYSLFSYPTSPVTRPPNLPNEQHAAEDPSYSRRVNAALLCTAVALMVAASASLPLRVISGTNALVFAITDALLPAAIPVAALWATRSRKRYSFLRLLLPLVGIALYYQLIFTGFGRIGVASLILSAVMVISWTRGWRFLKLAVLLITPISLVWAYSVANTKDPNETARGAVSFLAPLFDGATTIQMVASDFLPKSFGHTYYVALSIFVPDAFWPGKPRALGSLAVSWLNPQLQDTGHSVALIYTAEMYYNFEFIALIVGSLALGLLLVVLDRSLIKADLRMSSRWGGVIAFISLVLISVYLLFFVWAGSAAWTVRVYPRVVIAVLALILFWGVTGVGRYPGVKRLRRGPKNAVNEPAFRQLSNRQ